MANSSNKKFFLITLIVIVLLIINFKVASNNFLPYSKPPLEKPNTSDLPKSNNNQTYIDNTGLNLDLPDGFEISVLAENITGARVLKLDSENNLWVSRTGPGIISKIIIEDGKNISSEAVFKNLSQPHGIEFDTDDPNIFYIAETDKISVFNVLKKKLIKKIADLPSGKGHFTRTIGFGPDKKLYVSIGSSCNVCNENDERRAKIFSLGKDGKNFKEYARGLRNSVFFTWHPFTDEMWATDMGRDWLGDDLPPEEINIIKNGQNYGWPICYGKNVHDVNFDKNTYIRNPCDLPFETPSFIDLEAHSAPLGLIFINNAAWPQEYQNNLLVALHGSWNKSQPAGYQIIRIIFDEQGNVLEIKDFISGWLDKNNNVQGRPVDFAIEKNGNLYISDDKLGVIYKLKPI